MKMALKGLRYIPVFTKTCLSKSIPTIKVFIQNHGLHAAASRSYPEAFRKYRWREKIHQVHGKTPVAKSFFLWLLANKALFY